MSDLAAKRRAFQRAKKLARLARLRKRFDGAGVAVARANAARDVAVEALKDEIRAQLKPLVAAAMEASIDVYALVFDVRAEIVEDAEAKE
jgi:hypothetical protein